MEMTNTSNQQILTNPKIIELVNRVINSKIELPILKNVYLQRDRLTVYDLSTYVSIPYQSGIEACVPYQSFTFTLDLMKQPVFSTDGNLGICINGNGISETIKGGDPKEYPTLPAYKNIDFTEIGQWTPNEIGYLKNALVCVGKDELRKAMTGIYAGKHIAATDTYHLYWKAIEPPKREIIIPAKAARILTSFNNKNWTLRYGIEYAPPAKGRNGGPIPIDDHLLFTSDDGIIVGCKPIMERFPNFLSAVITDEGLIEMTLPVKDLQEELTKALQVADKDFYYMIVLNLNDSVEISAKNKEGKEEHIGRIESATWQFKDSGQVRKLTIAFNAKMLSTFLNRIKGEATFKFWKSNYGAIINDEYLIRSLMLND